LGQDVKIRMGKWRRRRMTRRKRTHFAVQGGRWRRRKRRRTAMIS
jgi:hypothetical protein